MKRVDATKFECLLHLIRSRRDGLVLHNDAYGMSDQQKITGRISDKRRDEKWALGLPLPYLGPLKSFWVNITNKL
jgi:hypothetical protein